MDRILEVAALMCPSEQRRLREYSDAEPRDAHGRWGSGGSSGTVDRLMTRNSGNPDAVAAVPDSQIKTFQSATHFNVATGKWETFNPKSGKYEPDK